MERDPHDSSTSDGETSLRAQIEEAIDEHVDEQATGDEPPAKGDLSPVELTDAAQPAALQRARRRRRGDPARRDHRGRRRRRAGTSWSPLFAEHGHSRLPVYRDTLDDVIGMMHIKDVFPFLATGKPPPADWTELMRQPLYVPQARGALDVLADMRAKRTHLAIVLDEFSGTDGIVTIEDLVEEIVGDIEDEHDDAPVELVVPLGEGMWDADARAELEDVAETVDRPAHRRSRGSGRHARRARLRARRAGAGGRRGAAPPERLVHRGDRRQRDPRHAAAAAPGRGPKSSKPTD